MKTAPPAKPRAADWKPIMDASFAGNPDAVRQLLAAGADPNVLSPTNHRHRPLHRAIEHKKTMPKHEGHDAVVRVLLAGGADPLARGTYMQVTPLALAAIGGETRFIPPLREQMPAMDIYHAAVLGDHKRVAALLKKNHGLAGTPDSNGWPPLLYVAASRLHWHEAAASAALVHCAEILIAAGADPNPAVPYDADHDLPALYYATGHGNHAALARLLLQHGAQPNDGESLTHCAENLYTECFDTLLEFGADVNDVCEWGNTALWFLLHWGAVKGVPWLLEHGADPNIPNRHRRQTALHAAVERGCNDKVLMLLLEHGADRAARDANGHTPLDLARAGGKARIVTLLQNKKSR